MEIDAWVFQSSRSRLQKPAPIDLDPMSHEPSPAVYAPLNKRAPIRPDSVPCQYMPVMNAEMTGWSGNFQCSTG